MDTTHRQAGDPPSDAQLRRELQAVVAAQQELGEGFGIELADAFVERLHASIDQRIEARLKKRGGGSFSLVLPIVSLAAGLLGMGIVSAAVGPFVGAGTLLVPWIPIVAINLVYAIRARH